LKKLFFALLVLGGIAAAAVWIHQRRSAPPEVPFARVLRQTLTSTLVTNGKVEPVEWMAVHAERDGPVGRLHVRKGQQVRKGDAILDLDTRDTQAELAAAEARIAQARADLYVFDRGGLDVELAEIESGVARARLDQEVARRELESLGRLVEKKAAAAQELTPLRDRIRLAESQVAALERKRAALVPASGRAAVQARLHEAETAAAQARRKIELSVIHAPMDGTIYHLEARPGAWIRVGDPVAEIGRIERLRVVVYVDEPELGRVETGMPVTITWDARPGRQWNGNVDTMPSRIVALGTRQVGEVICLIANEQRELAPGANINAEIRSRVVENALTVPKETLRREAAVTGVFVLEGDRLAWKPVELGASSVTHAQVMNGLADGALVALPTEFTLRSGDPVRAKVQ